MYKSLFEVEFVFICSGIVILEVVLIGMFFVLVYRVKMMDFLIVRMLVNLYYIGFVNIFYNVLNDEILGFGES